MGPRGKFGTSATKEVDTRTADRRRTLHPHLHPDGPTIQEWTCEGSECDLVEQDVCFICFPLRNSSECAAGAQLSSAPVHWPMGALIKSHSRIVLCPQAVP